MPWVVNFLLDVDKTNVGTATAVFTDTDTTIFSYNARVSTSPTDFQNFTLAAVAAMNAWKNRKTGEGVAITSLISAFSGAGQPASGGIPT